MTHFLRSTGGMLGSPFPAQRTDLRAVQAAYSLRQLDTVDVLWPRTSFVGYSNGLGSSYFDLSNGFEVWEWDWILLSEGKPGRRASLSGVTRDSSGIALGGVTVKAFDLARDVIVDTTTSDASGNFTVTTPFDATIYCVTYKAGTPVFGGSAQLTPTA